MMRCIMTTCPCACHGSGTAFTRPCDQTGGCYPNHRNERIRCGICRRHAATAGRTCNSCRSTIAEAITDLAALYDYLPFLIQPAAGSTPKVSGTRTPPLPGNLALMDFIGPGQPMTPGSPMPLRVALTALENEIRAQLHLSAPPLGHRTIPDLLEFLAIHNDGCCSRYEPVAEYRRSIMRIYNTLRDLCGEHRPSPIGYCPAAALNPTEPGESCNARLYASTYSTSISCRRCGTTWDYAHWRLLGAQMGLIAG